MVPHKLPFGRRPTTYYVTIRFETQNQDKRPPMSPRNSCLRSFLSARDSTARLLSLCILCGFFLHKYIYSSIIQFIANARQNIIRIYLKEAVDPAHLPALCPSYNISPRSSPSSPLRLVCLLQHLTAARNPTLSNAKATRPSFCFAIYHPSRPRPTQPARSSRQDVWHAERKSEA